MPKMSSLLADPGIYKSVDLHHGPLQRMSWFRHRCKIRMGFFIHFFPVDVSNSKLTMFFVLLVIQFMLNSSHLQKMLRDDHVIYPNYLKPGTDFQTLSVPSRGIKPLTEGNGFQTHSQTLLSQKGLGKQINISPREKYDMDTPIRGCYGPPAGSTVKYKDRLTLTTLLYFGKKYSFLW